jgi:hypothetical protein
MPYKDLKVRKEKHAEYSKKYYEANKEKHVKRVAARKKELRIAWQKYKSTLRCQQCGETHPATFDFHHVEKNPKNIKVSKLLQKQNYSAAREEVKKCIVLCANCHRIHHYEEAKQIKKTKKKKPHLVSGVSVGKLVLLE